MTNSSASVYLSTGALLDVHAFFNYSQTTSVMNQSMLGWHTNEIETSCAI